MASNTVISKPYPSGSSKYVSRVTDNGNGTVSSTFLRLDPKGGSPVVISENGKINTKNATAAEQKALTDPKSTLSQARSNTVTSTEKNLFPGGASKTQKDALAKASGSAAAQNSGSTPGSDQNGGKTSSEDRDLFAEESKEGNYKQGTRLSYEDLRYPENLILEHQDCIKFSILQYRPSAADAQKSGTSKGLNRIVKVDSGRPTIEGATRLGTITLPIPAGISDTNSVDWQQDEINELQTRFGTIAKDFIEGGAAKAQGSVNAAGEKAKEALNDSATAQGMAGMFAGLAVNSSKFQQRAYGSIFNSNLELLFNGPTLRSAFTFNFKLSPRSESEAKLVKKIIRAFKQAMAVKRSASSLLLKTPHTFAISYLTSNQDHPYLNKFKECALQSFNVDYTPEGQYMTYMSATPAGRSMVSYNLSLTFQELEPIFDDDYGALDGNNDTYIGF